MKKEIISAKTISITIAGKNEHDIDETMESFFEIVRRKVKRGHHMMKPKKIGAARGYFDVVEYARHV